ncbi:hypothetical protein, partial [Plantactinospora endophytica]|uniref:hypothetical protein n=1 Tax=Plantactinospora endophytica TaxID=673535 RepID=UPI0036285778
QAPDSGAAVEEDPDQGVGSLTVGLVVGLVLGLTVAAWLYLRRPRPDADEIADAAAGSGPDPEPAADAAGDSTPTDAPPTDGERAGSGGRAWRLRE